MIYLFEIYQLFFLKSSPIKLLSTYHLLDDQNVHFIHTDNFEYIDCFFERNNQYDGVDDTLTGNGGVIFCLSSKAVIMTITSCTFSQCGARSSGAIYFKSNFANSQAKLSKVCAYRCYAVSNGNYNFGSFSVSDHTTSKNEVSLTSVLNCNQFSQGKYTVLLHNGEVVISQYNVTENLCEKGSMGFYQAHRKLRASLCTFYKNKITGKSQLDSTGNNGEFTTSNFIGNNSPGGDGIITVLMGALTIKGCIFKDNQNLIFRCSFGTLTLNECYINHYDENSIYSGTISWVSSVIEDAPTHEIIHLSTYHCVNNIEPDQTPELTIQETLDLTPIETPLNTLECTPLNTIIDTLQNTPINTILPTISLTLNPTIKETLNPTISLTFDPTLIETLDPTIKETLNPTISLTFDPTLKETLDPT